MTVNYFFSMNEVFSIHHSFVVSINNKCGRYDDEQKLSDDAESKLKPSTFSASCEKQRWRNFLMYAKNPSSESNVQEIFMFSFYSTYKIKWMFE